MGGSSFDLIAQELLRQKQVMEQMESENQELRRQLADVRAGRGIFVEIDGCRFSLFNEYTTSSEEKSVEAMPIAVVEPVAIEPVAVEPEPQPEPVMAQHDVTQDETEELVMSIPETPRPTIDFYENAEEAEEQITEPTFLEEVMIDEFASAATSPLSVWSAPKQEQKPEIDEELAVLRRQLIGSYLLE